MTRLLRYRHDGFTFDVTDQGPLDGDPVVLLHGWPERATSWRGVAPQLHAAGLRPTHPTSAATPEVPVRPAAVTTHCRSWWTTRWR